MTLYDNFKNINLNYFNIGFNNPFVQPASMPDFGNNCSNIFTTDFSKMFAQQFNENVVFNNPFGQVFNNSSPNQSLFMPTFTPQQTFTIPPMSFDSWNSNTWQTNFNTGFDTFTYTSNDKNTKYLNRLTTSATQKGLVLNAKSYLGKVNSDKAGNKIFSGGIKQPWCADFVSYTTKQTYGDKLPSSFGHFSSVESLRDWGKSTGCYNDMPSTGKSDYIAKNVKPGDIMIEKNGGKSHTGIVTKVNSDGSFETVEGNCGNKVGTRTYTANSSTLSGFINLDKYSVT